MRKRQNIFDIINSQRNPIEEIERIDELLKSEDGVYVGDEFVRLLSKGTPTSIVKYVDRNLFKKWKARGTCICTDNLLDILNISEIPDEDELLEDSEFIFRYCEYAANIVLLLKQKILHCDTLGDNADAILKNIQLFLGWYNYEVKYYEEKEKALVVPKDASATAVAEILDSSLAYSVIEYNHYLLKGDIEKKKAILLALGNEIEPKRSEIESLNKQLASDIFFMLNNLDIRHNNRQKGDKHYKEKIARMRLSTLEKWYDELYQMMLLAILLLDNTERTNKINELKTKINGG